MKNLFHFFYITIFLIVIVQPNSYCNNLDTLLLLRNQTKSEYQTLISSPRTSPNTEREIFYYQNKIITLDDSIINTHLNDIVNQRNEAIRFAEIVQLKNTKTIARMEQRMEGLINDTRTLSIVLIGSLIICTLLVVLLIFLRIRYNRTIQKNSEAEYIIQTLKKKNSDLQSSLDSMSRNYQSRNNHIYRAIAAYRKGEKQAALEEGLPEKFQKIELQTLQNQAEIQELTETNNNLCQELQKLTRRESIMDAENLRLQHEITDLSEQISYLKNEIQKASYYRVLEEADEYADEATRLRSMIDNYRERIEMEEAARLKFEREVNEILKGFQKYVEQL